MIEIRHKQTGVVLRRVEADGLAGQPALVVIGEVVRLSSFAAELPQLHAQATAR